MNADEPDIWLRFQDRLRRAADEPTYDVWLSPLRCGGFQDGVLRISAPTEHRAWIAARFMDLLTGAAGEALGPCEVELVDGAGAEQRPGRPPQPPATPPQPGPALDARLTFEHFVIGEANRFGHAAALAVAEAPGAAFNPLFIYGPPGTGKTHLLNAIGNYVAAFGTGLTVHYATAETFTSEFVDAVKGGGIAEFKVRYRTSDVLLIDDVQFLQSKAATEEEFFHTFNALHGAGAQLVMTSDRAPADLAGLDARLQARFAAGLLVDIASPDEATRRAVLRKRALHDGLELDDAVVDFIASRVTNSIRALEGALIRVVAYASLQGRRADRELACELLDRLYPQATRAKARPTIPVIQACVAEAFGLSVEDLVGADRSARVAWPRQLAMYLAREHTSETLPVIGRHFGGRDHSTVIHAHRKATERLAADAEQFRVVRLLTERLLTGEDDRPC